MRGPAELADFADAGAHQHALVRDQHDFVIDMHQGGGDDLAIAFALLDGDHAFGATAVARVFGDARAFAVAVLGGGQHGLVFVLGHQHRYHGLAIFQHHAAHAARIAPHGANVVFVETHCLAAIGEQHDIVLAVGQCGTDQEVSRIEIDRDDAGLARVVELVQRGLLDGPHAGRHEDVLVRRKAAFLAGERQHDGDLLAVLQRKHVDDGASARATRPLRNLPHLEPVEPPAIGKTQDVVVGVGDEQLVDPIVFLGGRGLLAATPALLGAVLGQRLALDVPAVAQGHHHVGRGDQVFGAEVEGAVFNQAAARAELGLPELLPDMAELVDDDGRDALRLGQNVEQVFDLGHHLLVFGNDLVLLQAGQALQPHLEDFLRLGIRESVQPVAAHAEGFRQAVGPVVVGVDHATVGACPRKHRAYQRAVPGPVHQLGLGDRRRGRVADDRNEVVDVCQCHGKPLENMAAFAGLAQREHGAPRHDLAPVLEEHLDQVLEVAQLGLAVDQRHHVDAERVLQLRLLVQVVQHNLGHLATLELDDQAHAGLVALVLDVADALDLFLVHQFGHTLLQRLLVHLVGQLVDDDGLALALVDILKVAFGAHHDAAAAGPVAVLHAVDAIDDAGGREIRGRDDLHQFVDRAVRVPQQMQTGVHHLVQVVRRYVGRHADRDAA